MNVCVHFVLEPVGVLSPTGARQQPTLQAEPKEGKQSGARPPTLSHLGPLKIVRAAVLLNDAAVEDSLSRWI